MKVSKTLKVVALFMLLESLLFLGAGLLGKFTSLGGVSLAKAITWTVVFGTVQLVIAVGLLTSKKLAVYATPIFGAIKIFIAVLGAIQSASAKTVNIYPILAFIVFGVAIWQSISCIIKDRQQRLS